MRFSLLDLAPINQGSDATVALQHAADIAQHVEQLGYYRYWMAEHHNMPGIASAATAVALSYVGSRTNKIRIGSGGIMLPNHAPLVVAEQFGTLNALYPNRVDLGLGRAPGTDQQTLRALRRSVEAAEQFPNDVAELLHYLGDAEPQQAIAATPGQGSHIPVWLLGSSLFGAQLAAHMGLPYAFASHFAPDYLDIALQAYRENFRPSQYLSEPYAMAVMNVFAADTEQQARQLMSSMQQQFVALRQGNPGKLPKPVDDITTLFDPMILAAANHALKYSAVGDPQQVKQQLHNFTEQHAIDEVMLTCHAYDHEARKRSLTIAAQALAD
ncbi:LLM class flavin-dependent oxidoreductase [Idiomarina tyrosinivorans]|uniref:Luciferase-like monooxygenase n=1 Tax=Idiomarina tyrosinivorans TaxID=1445662 RepID=A0A432ZPX1_9GAMM|nr:LLM class flavin-dependent oxidoreductase [Idiomarina tyrosinivorans]RUO79985.1 LLM class flavin-dependent oxidoreductase [Idiomarina tyrosinivorans]